MHLETVDPKNVALIVIDTENAFCRGEADLPARGIVEAMSRLVPLVGRCREAGIPVIWAIRGVAASWNNRLLDPVATLAPELEQTVAIPADMALGQTELPELLSARAAESPVRGRRCGRWVPGKSCARGRCVEVRRGLDQ